MHTAHNHVHERRQPERTRLSAMAPGAGGRWIEWQELKFILVSVGLPVLLVALVVQLVPHLLRLF